MLKEYNRLYPPSIPSSTVRISYELQAQLEYKWAKHRAFIKDI